MRNRERGSAFILVLILLAVGTPLISSSLNLVNTGLTSKEIQTGLLEEQYSRDGGAEYAMWDLLYGDVASQLAQDGDEINTTMVLNGVETQIIIRLSGAPSGTSTVTGAEDNRVLTSMAVECDKDGDGFDDDCLALPLSDGMIARYTISLEQISPDESVGLVAIYDQLPKGFEFIPGSVISPDGSLPEIEPLTPTNIESPAWQIWEWDLSSSPIYFQRGVVKKFSFEAEINDIKGRYCNRVFGKMEALPNEMSDGMTEVVVGTDVADRCEGMGAYLIKYVDTMVALPNVNTIVTYIINVENIEQNSLHIDSIKDVLPPDGFTYCSPNFPPDDLQLSCDRPMWKTTDESFDPATGDFSDTMGFAMYNDPEQTLSAGGDRWELFWDGPGGSGWGLQQAGDPNDNLILRFQAQLTVTQSGTYYNEGFAHADCSAPSSLIAEGVTSQEEYCASYSWPTGGGVVPKYNVSSSSGGTTAQGLMALTGSDSLQLNSWHVN